MSSTFAPAGRLAPSRAFLTSGPVLMTLATLSFTMMVASVKVARSELGPFEVIAWRGVISIPLAAAFAWSSGLTVQRPRLLLVRSLFGFVAMACFFTAAKGLPLADVSLITRLQPVLVAVLAPLLLGAGEQTGPTIWGALAVGLAGCAIIIGPEFSMGTRYGLWALAATLASACAHTAVRALGRSDKPRAVVFWFQLSNLPFALAAHFALVGTAPTLPNLKVFGAVLVCGVTATVGQLLMTKAYQQDRAAIVAGASYSGPIWAVLLDLLVFGLAPGWTMAAGGALVVIAGLLLYRGSKSG